MSSPRASNLFFLIMGAVSVAIVAGVLAASGVFDRTDAGAQSSAAPPLTTTPASTTSAVRARPTSRDIYKRVSTGVVFVHTGQGQATGSGFVHRRRGPHRHQRPRGRGRQRSSPCASRENGEADPRQARRQGPVDGPRAC